MLALSVAKSTPPVSRVFISLAFGLLVFVALEAMAEQAASSGGIGGERDTRHRVGLGDSRENYESSSFVTHSEAIVPLVLPNTVLEEGANQGGIHEALEYRLGLPPLKGGLRPEEVALGRALFFDRRLSANATLSCGMCHIPEQGFTQNELATPVGHEGRSVRRNAPSLYNVAFRENLFLDGRESSLENQVWSPLLAANEMANDSRAEVIARIAAMPEYGHQFANLYEEGLTERTLSLALASYQRSLVAGTSPFDLWYFGAASGDGTTGHSENRDSSEHRGRLARADFSPEAEKGFVIFLQAGCAACHTLESHSAMFADGRFHNTGVGFRRENADKQPHRVQLAPGIYIKPSVSLETEVLSDQGRSEVTGNKSDRWRYRTPTLRNVSATAPYMHDGSIPNLKEVIAFYNEGGGGDPQQDARIRPLGLTASEQDSLIAFLESLRAPSIDLLAQQARAGGIGDLR
jgi:cytochrome c peroxidase